MNTPRYAQRTQSTPRRALAAFVAAVSLAAGVSLLAAGPAAAVGTRSFLLTSLDDFKGGDLTGVSVDSSGNVRAGLNLGSLPIPEASSVWSSALLGDGTVLLGTGSEGKIFRVGGAQAIAALAYGTRTIAPVDRITGPGNAYVAEAKRQVFGRVGIDGVAGPSEVLILADAQNNPRHVAIDLLAQAEHDESAQSILITDDPEFAAAVVAALDHELQTLPRAAIAGASWRDHGAIILVRDWTEAAALTDRLAPEHLQIMVADPKTLFGKIRHAGSAFLGRFTPEALGDYIAGPNHVLPTGRTARFASGLSTSDFLKRTTWIEADATAFAQIAPAGALLATAEGLQAHALSLTCRLPDESHKSSPPHPRHARA